MIVSVDNPVCPVPNEKRVLSFTLNCVFHVLYQEDQTTAAGVSVSRTNTFCFRSSQWSSGFIAGSDSLESDFGCRAAVTGKKRKEKPTDQSERALKGFNNSSVCGDLDSFLDFTFCFHQLIEKHDQILLPLLFSSYWSISLTSKDHSFFRKSFFFCSCNNNHKNKQQAKITSDKIMANNNLEWKQCHSE